MSLKDKLEAARAKVGLPEATTPPTVHDPECIPDDPYEGSDRTDLKEHVTLLEGYQKYISPLKDGFYPVHRASQRESIKVRCPFPGHVDRSPSAWVNSDKDLGHCGVCECGFDLFDLAAIELGYSVPAYRRDKDAFKEVAGKIAEDFGLEIKTTISGTTITRSDYEDDAPPGDPPGSEHAGSASSDTTIDLTDPPPPPDEHMAEVADLSDFRWGDVEIDYPEIDYSVCVTPGTFIDSWVNLGESLNYTKAHFLFTALPAISLAVRRHLIGSDEPAIRNNLYVVLLGESGSTKTKAQALFIRLIKQAFDPEDPEMGVRLFVPISGEHLIEEMIVDPAAGNVDNPGCIITNEYARLAQIMDRPGSTMETYLQDFYDNWEHLKHPRKGIAPHHQLCMVTTTQPDAVKDHLKKEHVQSGYANRLIFSWGPPGKPDAWNKTVDLGPHVKLLQEIYAHYAKLTVTETVPTPEARDYWEQFLNDVIIPDKRSSTRLLTRVDLHLKKLFNLFQANELSPEVNLHHVEQACSLYPYLKKSAEFVQGKIGFGLHEDCHDDIASYLKRKRYQNTKRLVDAVRKRGHQYPVVHAVLNMMKALEEIDTCKVKGQSVWYLTDSGKPAEAARETSSTTSKRASRKIP